MKCIAVVLGLGLALALPSWLMAQQDVPPPPPPPPYQDEAPPPPPPPQAPPPQQSAYYLNHGEVGVFADYFRFTPGNRTSDYIGVGGRVGFNVSPNVALEGEMSYDFARAFTSTFTTGTTTTVVKTNLRPITALFGPKFQFGRSSDVRVFVEGKMGFIHFSTSSNGAVTGGSFGNAVTGVGGPGTHVAFYPGGGFEGFWGPVGIRLDAGDEIYLDNGTHNNLRITLGPVFRF